MREIDLGAVDLNLLVVLDVLLEERNVTRAARRLHRTQSATSHALARLRTMLEDPILVRVGGEMRPTPRAQALAGDVSRLLKAIGRVLGDSSRFELATSDRVFRVCGPDFVAAALPPLIAEMALEAPSTSVELAPAGPGLYRDVVEGRFDVAVAPPPAAPIEGLCSESLGALDWVVYAREGHPAIASWGAATWARYPHLRVRTASGADSPVDRAALARGLRRPVGPMLPHFLLAPPLLARSDQLMTVPRAVLADVAARFALVALPCPLRLRPVPLGLHWSAMLAQDPANRWFRERVRAAVSAALLTHPEAVAATAPGRSAARRRRPPASRRSR